MSFKRRLQWLAFASLVVIECAGAAPLPGKVLSENEMAERLKYYGAIQRLDVQFKQVKTLRQLGVSLKSEGRLLLVRPDFVSWQILKPYPLKVTLTKDAIRMSTGAPPEEKVQTFERGKGLSAQADQALVELVAWLNLDVKTISRKYRIFDLGHGSYRFEPIGKAPFQAIQIEVTQAGPLKAMRIEELSGDQLDITFEKPGESR